MTEPLQPASDVPTPTSGAGSDWGYTAPAPAPTARRGRGRVFAAAAGTVALVGLAAGGTYAVSALRGGGAQPEAALPANTIAFAKVDLDPSSGQKIDAIRFIRKFPAAKEKFGELGDSVDLRKLIVEQMQKDGQLKGLNYDTDIEPWLGKRFAVALVPGSDNTTPVPVAMLAVTDKAKAETALSKADNVDCTVTDEFALCGETAAAMETVQAAGAKASLAGADGFTGDMKDLGEDGMLSFWADLGAAKSALGSAVKQFGGASPTELDSALQGKLFGALRFDGANLELAAHVRDAKESFEGGKGDNAIGDLPADTLAAVSINDLGPNLQKQWTKLESTLTDTTGDSMSSLEQQLGMSLPDDLVKLLGTQTTLAFGGMGTDNQPKFALKTNGDAAVATKLVNTFADQGLSASVTPIDGGMVAGTGDYAAAVAQGSGLSGKDLFKKAVPSGDKAQMAMFADIAGLIAAFGADLPDSERANLAPLEAFGLSATAEGTSSDIAIRLTTK